MREEEEEEEEGCEVRALGRAEDGSSVKTAAEEEEEEEEACSRT